MSTPPPARASSDRNLLFGILALQADLISRDALISAMSAWTLAKSRPLGEILLEQGAFDADAHALVEALVEKSLARHDGNVEQSLAALSSIGSARQQLEQLGDPDLNASLPHVSAGRGWDDSVPTECFTVGTPTSSGLRFRILRHHAKGGLGQVSVAMDEELHREVALKEIQEHYADIPDYRARFLREAEITGGLEHPGIVPVYGLGQYADGRPFYAMRFIKGDNLKNAIERFHHASFRDPGQRTLGLRTLLGRFLNVCNAVAYAHSRGVLHRDLKPGNIMLGPYGETLLVDWGLAKPLEPAEGNESGAEALLRPVAGSGSAPTRMGQRIGTLAYMSPEQARGELDRVGPASDVYSLGATLYAVLTGQAPFSEQDPDMIAKLERGEFPPPRQVNRRVPPALQAICQKAMAANPEERYPTPRALADDVEHWLADEPVKSHREPILPRLARWGRRHRPLVAGAAVLLITAVAALAAGIVVVSAEQKRTELARQRTREALDDMSSQVIEDWLAQRAELEPAQRAFLEKALASYEVFASESGQTREVRESVADAHQRVGQIRLKLGQHAEAEAAYLRARELYTTLSSDFPAMPQYRKELARSSNNIGIVLSETGKPEEAEVAYQDALVVYRQLVADFPAEPTYRQAMAQTNNNLGIFWRDRDHSREAESAFREALKTFRQLVEDFRLEERYREGVATTLMNLGLLLREAERPKEAEADLREARSIFKKLANQSPRYREYLAESQSNLGLILQDTNRPKEAADSYREALAIYKRLVARFGTVLLYRQELARTYNNLGGSLSNMDQVQEAGKAYHDALAIYESLIEDFPKMPDHRAELANTLDGLARLACGRKDFPLSRQLLEQAHPHLQAALESNPKHPFYRETSRDIKRDLAATLLDLADHPAAAAAAVDLARIGFEPVNDTYKAAGFLARCVPLAEKDAKLPDAKRKEFAKSYADRAMEMLRQAVAKGYKDLANIKKDADLEPLRSRDDFKTLLSEMEQKAK
jgi:serine/threonine-protein kinase